MIPLPSHSLKQWGQPGEILGGVRCSDETAKVWCCMPPKPGGVVSNTGKHEIKKRTLNLRNYGDLHALLTLAVICRLSDGEAAGGPHVCEIKTKTGGTKMTTPNVNVDYCGIVNLLRQLVEKELLTRQEAKKIAARIAVDNRVEIILFI